MNGDGIIIKLPDVLASQIAAGEVVERPASVVKELIENALDAEATRIVVELDQGGLERIRVSDDGTGMSPRDALMCLERHATSKIRSVDDLLGVATLGFRGEALPSIASVCRFELSTCLHGAVSGVRVTQEGAAPPRMVEAGVPAGTSVEVRDLFFDIPARRKFLRSPAAELKRIQEFFVDFALGYPHIHFRLVHNGRSLADYPGERDLRARLHGVLGRDIAPRLYPVQLEGAVRIDGFMGEPGLHSPQLRSLHTFVNGRPVRDRVIQSAITTAYGTLLDRGRHPLGVLYVLLDPASVDVNVHPAKAEVRFVAGDAVHGAVRRALVTMLQQAPWLQDSPRPDRTEALVREAPAAYSGRPAAGTNLVTSGAPRRAFSFRSPVPPPQIALDFLPPPAAAAAGPDPVDEFRYGQLNFIGQAQRTYLLCQDALALYVIDQHAAHERVNYARLQAEYRTGSIARQPLLIPMPLEVSAPEAEAVEQAADEITALGFELTRFGVQVIVVRAIPVVLAQTELSDLIRDLVSDLTQSGKAESAERRVDRILATVACHGSIRAGATLDVRQVQALLQQMDETSLASHCPHGRPAVVRYPWREVAAWFGRSGMP